MKTFNELENFLHDVSDAWNSQVGNISYTSHDLPRSNTHSRKFARFDLLCIQHSEKVGSVSIRIIYTNNFGQGFYVDLLQRRFEIPEGEDESKTLLIRDQTATILYYEFLSLISFGKGSLDPTTLVNISNIHFNPIY